MSAKPAGAPKGTRMGRGRDLLRAEGDGPFPFEDARGLDGSNFGFNGVAKFLQIGMLRLPHGTRGDVFVIMAIDVAGSGHSLPVDRRWRTFKSAGKRRDASEMISRQRVTVYMAR